MGSEPFNGVASQTASAGAVTGKLFLLGRKRLTGTHAMPAVGLPLRSDYDGEKLRLLAATTRGFAIRRRLLAIAEIYDGASRTDAAEVGGVTLQALRAWVAKFNAGGPNALRNNYPSAINPAPRVARASD